MSSTSLDIEFDNLVIIADSFSDSVQNTQLQQQLSVANATIANLQNQLGAARETINSLVLRLFGALPDENVATAARDVAQEALEEAIAAVGAADRRVQRAQRNFNEGLAALAGGDYRRAVREFDQAFSIAQRILN